MQYASLVLSTNEEDAVSVKTCENGKCEGIFRKAQFLSVLMNDENQIAEAWYECEECRDIKLEQLKKEQ